MKSKAYQLENSIASKTSGYVTFVDALAHLARLNKIDCHLTELLKEECPISSLDHKTVLTYKEVLAAPDKLLFEEEKLGGRNISRPFNFCQFTKNIKLTCTFCHRIDYSDRFIQKFMIVVLTQQGKVDI